MGQEDIGLVIVHATRNRRRSGRRLVPVRLLRRGTRLVTGGTSNHIVLMDAAGSFGPGEMDESAGIITAALRATAPATTTARAKYTLDDQVAAQ